MDAIQLKSLWLEISNNIVANKDYLTKLDQQMGDGDLGVSMSNGYVAVSSYFEKTDETDVGKLLLQGAQIFNDAAPSSLGTIICICMMGMASALKGKKEVTIGDLTIALESGINKIMQRTGSKLNEKTMLDALIPAYDALKKHTIDNDWKTAFKDAAQASEFGAEKTRSMLPIHGRAAYYGDKSIGMIDGGAVVMQIVFKAAEGYFNSVYK